MNEMRVLDEACRLSVTRKKNRSAETCRLMAAVPTPLAEDATVSVDFFASHLSRDLRRDAVGGGRTCKLDRRVLSQFRTLCLNLNR
jgi:hypothetical protein